MRDWKRLLYDHYVSSGQAGYKTGLQDSLRISNYPYYGKLIADHLPKDKDIAIADLACGHGALLFCLKELDYFNIKGVDISPEQVDLAHRLGLKEIECRDIESFLLESERSFDVVFLMDILEHLKIPELFDLLSLVRKSLRKDGLVIIHVPNAEGIHGMRIRYGDLTHENCFTPKSISQALAVHGFKNIQCFEDKPIIHGAKSMFRHVIWTVFTMPDRLLLTAETGGSGHILSQNMLVTASV